MGNEKIDASTVFTMFEEIKTKLNQRPVTQQPAPVPQPQPMPPSRVQHVHSVDLYSSRAAAVFVSLAVVLFVSVILNFSQCSRSARLRDNDLKYRYIQMRGGTSLEELFHLERIFTFDRNRDSIRTLRRRVERYEQLVKQQAETAARAKYNASEAERLKKEVEEMKN
jgi:hypothetical protein